MSKVPRKDKAPLGLFKRLGGVSAMVVILAGCPQEVEHYFLADNVPVGKTLHITAGGKVRFHWNMEWRLFQPKLKFHLTAIEQEGERLPCDMFPIRGKGAQGEAWIGLQVADDCPTTEVPMKAWVSTVYSDKPLNEQVFNVSITENASVRGVVDRFSPPDGEPNSNRKGWRLVNNFTLTESLSLGEESLLKRGRWRPRCRATPPAPPPTRGSIFVDAIYGNCAGGQSNLIGPVVIPISEKPKDGEATDDEAQSSLEPKCKADFGGPASTDLLGYAPRTGKMLLSFDFSEVEELEKDHLLGCRYTELMRGAMPENGEARKIGKKRTVPMELDMKKYDRLTFMARTPRRDEVWVALSMSYWTHLAPKPKESLAKDFKISGDWRRYEVGLDFGLWVDASQRKRSMSVQFDLFKSRASCDGRQLDNPESGVVEIANIYFIERGVNLQ
ncbi:MAG: hypothetical protein VYA34_04280 [Myxococcota bacterium]|nr:hypothetical protein [Myxococcota bacterium]